jgi:hypothetical protein
MQRMDLLFLQKLSPLVPNPATGATVLFQIKFIHSETNIPSFTLCFPSYHLLLILMPLITDSMVVPFAYPYTH